MEDSLNRAIVSQRLQPCEPLKEYQTPTFNPILWVILEIDFPFLRTRPLYRSRIRVLVPYLIRSRTAIRVPTPPFPLSPAMTLGLGGSPNFPTTTRLCRLTTCFNCEQFVTVLNMDYNPHIIPNVKANDIEQCLHLQDLLQWGFAPRLCLKRRRRVRLVGYVSPYFCLRRKEALADERNI
jgi:hypothetical protein